MILKIQREQSHNLEIKGFSVTQMLDEINFGNPLASKTAILSILWRRGPTVVFLPSS